MGISKQTSLKIIMILALLGMTFSGYLSYVELFTGECNTGIVSCGVKTGTILSLPACVYGFFMYTIVFVVSLLGYRSKK